MGNVLDPIEIVRASSQNLDTVSLRITRGQITILSGPSACGKTALAINTLGAESQYRLAVLNGKRIEDAQRPAVDKISQLPPCLTLPSFGVPKLQDSVVSFLGADTILGALTIRLGKRLCPKCQSEILQQDQADGLDTLFKIASGRMVSVVANLYKKPLNYHRQLSTIISKEIDRLISKGFVRILINEAEVKLDTSDISWKNLLNSELDFESIKTIGVIVDRLTINESNRFRLAQSVESAAKISHLGVTIYEIESRNSSLNPVFRLIHGASCQQCGYESFRLSPTLFDFSINSKSGGYFGLTNLSPEHRDEFLQISIEGISLKQILEESTSETSSWISKQSQPAHNSQIAALSSVLKLLIDLGLGYLSLSKQTSLLSSGEWQRLRIVQLLSRRIPGIMYILDMPSLYLHSQDKIRLASTIGNFHSSGLSSPPPTILIVDNSPELFGLATSEIELGCGGGPLGGTIIYAGKPRPKQDKPLPTDLKQPSRFKMPAHIVFSSSGHLGIKPFNVSIPVGGLTVISGVSGSGKTVFMYECLLPAVTNWIAQQKALNRPTKSNKPILDRTATKMMLEGGGSIKRVISLPVIAQSQRSKSTVAQQIGIFELLTKLFAMLPLSKQRGYTPNTFSQDSSGNFESGLLEVRFRGYSIADIVKLNVSEASSIFTNIPGSNAIWQAVQKLHLEYLPLEREIRCLSTSEWQRLLLLPILVRPPSDAIFLIDYPCAGLDETLSVQITRLLKELAQAGNTIVVTDNSVELENVCDYLIELGPKAALSSGNIIRAEQRRPTTYS